MLALSEEKYHSVLLTTIRDILFLFASHAIDSLHQNDTLVHMIKCKQEEI